MRGNIIQQKPDICGHGSGDSNLNYPLSVAVAIAVSKWRDHKVKIFFLQDDYQFKLGSHDKEDAQF